MRITCKILSGGIKNKYIVGEDEALVSYQILDILSTSQLQPFANPKTLRFVCK
jgi:hypothetical protein